MITKVSPYKTISSQNGVMRTDPGGARHPTYDQWKQSWDGHRFPPPPAGSVLYLPGYPGQGSVIKDFSGQGNHGTISGATWIRLPSGLWTLYFDAQVGTLVTVPHAASIKPTDAISLMTWCNPTNFDSHGILFDCYSATPAGYRLMILKTTGVVRFGAVYDGSWETNDSDTGLTAGQYQHVAVTWESGNGVFYKNGQPDGTHARPGSITQNTQDLHLGEYTGGAAARLLGYMGVWVIYDAVLAAGFINAHYQQTRHLLGV